MKRLISLCAAALSLIIMTAQNTIDHFTVGPYEVDYKGNGNIKYRIQDNIDLYDFFELQKDTIINVNYQATPLVKNAFGISLKSGISYNSANCEIEANYAISICQGVYFTPGVSVGISSRMKEPKSWSSLEFGVPLTIGYSELNRKNATLYANIGVKPIYYTMSKKPEGYTGDDSGILISPIGEYGFNIPCDGLIWRIGIWGEARFDMAKADSRVYRDHIGIGFAGIKLGVLF